MKSSSNFSIVAYTDGGSRGNPGPAALGVSITEATGKLVKGYSKYLGRLTNNEAEYSAVLFALQKIRALYGKEKIRGMPVEIRLDSELVVRQLNGQYKIEEERLWPFFVKIWNTRLDFGNLCYSHVPRSRNLAADRLVNEALDREQGRLL